MAAVIAFISQKGGVGKSTLARALAAVCAQAGLEVVLADLDPRQQTLISGSHRVFRLSPLTMRPKPSSARKPAMCSFSTRQAASMTTRWRSHARRISSYSRRGLPSMIFIRPCSCSMSS